MFRKLKELTLLLRKLNELDELKNSVNDTRNQLDIIKNQLTDLNETAKKNQEKLYRFDWEPNQNIKQRMQDIATRDTAQFIMDEMNGGDVVPLNVTLDILDLGLQNIGKAVGGDVSGIRSIYRYNYQSYSKTD